MSAGVSIRRQFLLGFTIASRAGLVPAAVDTTRPQDRSYLYGRERRGVLPAGFGFGLAAEFGIRGVAEVNQ